MPFSIYILYLNLFSSPILLKCYYTTIWLKIINYPFWPWIINTKKKGTLYTISLTTCLKKLILYFKSIGITIKLRIIDKIISTNHEPVNYKRSL